MYESKCTGCVHQILVTPYSGNSIGIGCVSYANPKALWRRGVCPRATHVERKKEEIKRVNPLKASKRKGRG